MTNTSSSKIAKDFVAVAKLAGVTFSLSDIEVEELPAPHHWPSALPPGRMAVYAFLYGKHCLKVGKAGPKSSARYCSQHYGLNAPSTLAKALIYGQDCLGVSGLTDTNIGKWICQNTKRVNYLLPSQQGVALLTLLEAFIQCRLNPVFEGFKSQKAHSNKRF